MIAEAADLENLDETERKTLERLQRWHVHLLATDHLPARERALAGKTLADLGDPRPAVLTVDAMEFCRVPAGPFQMGSAEDDGQAWDDEKPAHEVDLSYDFSIGKYPVTGGQFRQYLEASEQEPESSESLRRPLNAPVVWVSWHEAQRFCAWLTERWREAGSIEPGWKVALPSEAEWEKAARGTDGRIYPWGEIADPERASYDETGIWEPSSIGCYPLGTSPYGCEEMSGNVWEWTRSLYEEYPYSASGGERAQREDLSKPGPRVLRGGSVGYDSGDVRCAVRHELAPTNRFRDIGFRVVLLPFSSDP